MQIIVKHEGSNDAITLTVEPSHTIKNVKDQIKNENAFPMPVPVSEARLVCRKDPNVRDFFLKDDNTLLSYGIQDGCEIGLSYSIVTGDRKLDEDDCRICHNSTSKPSVQFFSDPSNSDGLKVAVGICGHKVRWDY